MSKEHCCCGSIHTGALIIGYLILILGNIGLLASVVTGDAQGILSNVLSVIIGGCILYADGYHKPEGYLPYLIFKAIGIYAVFVVFVIIATKGPGTLLSYTRDYGYGTQYKDREINSKTAFCLILFSLAFIEFIAIWLWMVVYRAFQHMKVVEEYEQEQIYQGKLNDV